MIAETSKMISKCSMTIDSIDAMLGDHLSTFVLSNEKGICPVDAKTAITFLNAERETLVKQIRVLTEELNKQLAEEL